MKNSKAIWTVKTECGPIREKNEDAIYPDKSGSSNLPIKAGIFDGMGGHKKGEVASLIASEVMNGSLSDITDYVNGLLLSGETNCNLGLAYKYGLEQSLQEDICYVGFLSSEGLL